VEDPEEVLRRLRDVIEKEVEVSGLRFSTESSTGFVVIPDDGIDVDELLQRADVRCTWPGAAYRRRALRPDPGSLQLGQPGPNRELRHAIDNDELVLHYQPKVTLPQGEIGAVELWSAAASPRVSSPRQVRAAAERTDLIERLTQWVLNRALSDMNPRIPAFAQIAVLSTCRPATSATLGSGPLSSTLFGSTACRQPTHDRDHRDRFAHRPGRATRVLTGLAALGVGISMRRLRIGQTSLGFLSSLPVHELKIDKGFVTDMTSDVDTRRSVRSIVDLGHNLLLKVVAEGVETEDVLAELRRAGCDMAQGFFFARPCRWTGFAHAGGGANAPGIGSLKLTPLPASGAVVAPV